MSDFSATRASPLAAILDLALALGTGATTAVVEAVLLNVARPVRPKPAMVAVV